MKACEHKIRISAFWKHMNLFKQERPKQSSFNLHVRVLLVYKSKKTISQNLLLPGKLKTQYGWQITNSALVCIILLLIFLLQADSGSIRCWRPGRLGHFHTDVGFARTAPL